MAKNRYLLVSPRIRMDEQIAGTYPHGDWRIMFGEVFCVAALILAKHQYAQGDINYSVLLCCAGFNTAGKEISIRQTYVFFRDLFKAYQITSGKILIDLEASIVLDGLVDNTVTLQGTHTDFTNSQSRFNCIKKFYSDRKKKEIAEANVYHCRSKNETLRELLNLHDRIPNFSETISNVLSVPHQQSLVLYIKNQITTIEPFIGQSIILMLRKRGMSAYDLGREDYEITDKIFLSKAINEISTFNMTLRDSSKIKRIFLLGDDPEDTYFFGPGSLDSPVNFLRTLSNNLELCVFNRYKTIGKDICGDANLQLLAQSFLITFLKQRYNVRVGLGPNSGGTHALATFGISALFTVEQNAKTRFFLEDKALRQKSPYFPVSPAMIQLGNIFRKSLNRKLFDATYRGDLNEVTLLLDLGADINSQHIDSRNSYTGKTSLFIAAEMGYDSIVKLLLGKGANRNIRDLGLWRPYDVALVMEHQYGRKECSQCVIALK